MRHKLLHYGHKAVKSLISFCGIFFLACCLFAFTTGPFYLYHYLGTGNSCWRFRPKAILLLGGTPMPSESALIRCYTVRKIKSQFPQADIYISQLKEEKQTLQQSAAWEMHNEIQLGLRDTLQVQCLTDGHSTREEAILFSKRFPSLKDQPVVLVTSPEHMFRAVATFRKAGFTRVGGEATFGWAGNADFRYRDRKLGGRDVPVDVGENLQLRYQFWNHLRYQLLSYREILAILWYKVRGWA